MFLYFLNMHLIKVGHVACIEWVRPIVCPPFLSRVNGKFTQKCPMPRDDVARSFLLGRFFNDVSKFFLILRPTPAPFVFASDIQYLSLLLN